MDKKHLGKRRVAECETEVAGIELYLEEKKKSGISIQGSLGAGFLPQLLCAQGWAFPCLREQESRLFQQPLLSFAHSQHWLRWEKWILSSGRILSSSSPLGMRWEHQTRAIQQQYFNTYKSWIFLELLQVFRIKTTQGKQGRSSSCLKLFHRIFPNYQIFVFEFPKYKGRVYPWPLAGWN